MIRDLNTCRTEWNRFLFQVTVICASLDDEILGRSEALTFGLYGS
jgi:hypothetical protein